MRPPALALLVLASCASAPAPAGPAGAPDAGAAAGPAPAATRAPDPNVRALPQDWLDVAPSAFAARLERWALEPAAFQLDGAGLLLLRDTLRLPGEPAARAAVVLAHAAAGGDREARDALAAQLELRAPAPSRAELGGDIVCAGALRPHAREAGIGARLAALAVGPRPHPELDVRVECARTALLGGERAEVVPFLLRVLVAETPAQALEPPDWERVTTLAWTKTRAAEALAAHAGVPCTFRPDASWADQTAGARELAEAVARRRAR